MSAVGIGAAVAGASVASAGVNVLFAPYTAANNFIGSFFFGYGMILGERLMYQQDWPRIQERLAKGEKLFNIQNDYTREALNMITKQALEIKMAVNDEFLVPILQELLKMFGVDKIGDVLTKPRGETDPRVGRGSPVPRPSEPPRTTTFVPPTNLPPTVIVAPTIKQPTIPEPPTRGKIPATQYIIKLRGILIRRIAELGNKWKTTSNFNSKQTFAREITRAQQELVNLLQKYKF